MNRDLDDLVAMEFNLAGLPRSGTWWTPAKASKAADIVLETYENGHTRVYYLSRLRKYLKSINASEEAVKATLRPDITTVRNAQLAENLKTKTAKGLDIPEQFKSVDELEARVKQFLKDPKATAENLADWIVTFCARKKEALTLKLEGDQLVGALKQRGLNEKFDIVSCLPLDLCKRYMTAWNKLDPDDVNRAIRRLDRICQKTYGCSPQNLREVGAFLASRQGSNEGSKLATMKKALRHNPSNLASPAEHYMSVNDPNEDIIMALNQTDPADHDEILQFIKRRKLQ
jgi:hypothetical protein